MTAQSEAREEAQTAEGDQASEDHSQSGVFSCPKDGCVRVFQRLSALEKHLSSERCKMSIEKQSLFDLAKIKYKANLEEGVGVLPSLKCSLPTEKTSDLPAVQGWALKESKKYYHFNDRQRSYLIDKFNVGQTSGRKLSSESVAKDMRRARGADGLRLFEVSEFLTVQQISSFFSRMAGKIRGQSVEDIAIDEAAVEDAENFAKAREVVLSVIQLQHPVTYDNYDLCSMTKKNKLKSLKVPMLQIICEALELDVPVPPVNRKRPYMDLLKGVVQSCTCST